MGLWVCYEASELLGTGQTLARRREFMLKPMLDALDKEIVIMHPGPINRGVELSSAVVDSNQAIILDQVENGVAIRMAVLYLLAAKN